MKVLDLFSGIGGFSLGLGRAGYETVAFCEIDPWARRVLAKHWPGVPCFHDIKEVTGGKLEGAGVELVCGGFPCQDISSAGKGAGLQGARSGLWFEMLRVVGEVQPRWVLVENVPALRTRGIDTVCAGLERLRYSVLDPFVVGAADIGAPHLRRRVWIVAHDQSSGRGTRGQGRSTGPGEGVRERRPGDERLAQREGEVCRERSETPELQGSEPIPHSDQERRDGGPWMLGTAGGRKPENPDWWAVEPDVGRVAHGVPARVDRLEGLGNAVVPQIVEVIGRAILRVEALL